MGRKIPAKRHRGVKDPLIQIAKRNACPTLNAAPSKPNEQELPKSVLEIQRLCAIAEERSKNGKGKKKKFSSRYDPIDSLHLFDKDPKLPGMRRKDRDIPRIIQMQDEPDEAFMHRFSAAAHEFINEVQLENKYDVKFEHESKGLQTRGSKTTQDEEIGKEKSSGGTSKQANSSNNKKQDVDILDELNLSNKRQRNIRRFGKNPKERVSKPNKRQRRKQRLATVRKEEHYENELGSSDEEMDFSLLKDDIKFGEVVHRPPQFTVKPRGSEFNSKPGTKDLLLKKMMNGSNSKDTKKANTSNLSNAQKYFLEKERLRVVQAYRDLKASKMKK